MALLNRRKKEVKAEYSPDQEYPRGGNVPDAPESCPWRRKFESHGKWWTETTFCGFHCDRAITCQAYRAYQREQDALRRANR